ncbi:hypothetical protein FM120_34720 [Sphingobacterium faecium PCAi_F2.5]|nr:hypothetical protein BN1088_1430732 [Sphingobacterium sp. PM2-P1-29]SJN52240.1 hypothetical protein FM120_34720 [Sphingobacterium faecium PCAi_F2.5]
MLIIFDFILLLLYYIWRELNEIIFAIEQDHLPAGFILNLIKKVNRFKKQCETDHTDQ